VERRPATDERPELPSQPAVSAAEDPPTLEKVLPFRVLESLAEFLQAVFVFQIALNFFLQRLQHARHRNQQRHPFTPDRANDVGRFQGILKNYRAAKQLGKKYPQELAEDMTQWQQVQKSHWMHQAFVLEILLNLSF